MFRMRLLGAEVLPATSGSKTLKDAVNEAMRDWVATVEDSHYCLGSVMGPHPYPWMVREFQRVIGNEAREQILFINGINGGFFVGSRNVFRIERADPGSWRGWFGIFGHWRSP